MPDFPVESVRLQFPSLARFPDFLFFDNAAGAQVPVRVVQAVTDHLELRNVQRGGPYRHSREVDAMIARTRESVAAFVNASGPDEIAFGPNATSFIREISLAVGRTLDGRREIVVSDADHEANIGTWLALAQTGATIRWWRTRDDGRLHTADLDGLLSERTRLVACTLASNATGTIVDVADAARRVHRVGAEIFVDAVHYAPHGPIDVQALDCDYLVCSGYKIFGPHMGFIWCRREAINRLPVFRTDVMPDVTPHKLEAGTGIFENIAGMDAAIGYLESLGRDLGGRADLTRASALQRAMAGIAAYEQTLTDAMLDAVTAIKGLTVHGVTDRARLHERVPTLAFTVEGQDSGAIARDLARRDVGVRSGHMYSPRLIHRMGLPPSGTVRASLVHYNTQREVTRFAAVAAEIVAARTRNA